MNMGRPCLFVGESGTAKTVTIQQHLDSLDPAAFLTMNMSFSSRTLAADVQISIEDGTEKRTKVLSYWMLKSAVVTQQVSSLADVGTVWLFRRIPMDPPWARSSCSSSMT